MQLTKLMNLNVSKIGSLIYNLIFTVVIVIAGLITISSLNIPGNYRIYSVQSGSMEPAVKKGGLVVVKPVDEYKVGDIITVVEPANPKVSLTHRIVEVKADSGKTVYITKGDANKSVDTESRPHENVVGKVIFTIPLIGYPVSFARTRDGLIMLVIIPATIIIYSELIAIKNEGIRLIREKRSRKLSPIENIEEKIGEEYLEIKKDIGKVIRKSKKT